MPKPSASARSAGGRRVPAKKNRPFWKKAGWSKPPTKLNDINLNIHLLTILANGESDSRAYDAIREYEIENGFEKEYLINYARHSADTEVQFDREKVNTSADNGSFHAWIRKADGTIRDPHFPEYDTLVKMPNCDASQKVYHEWTPEQQEAKLKNSIPRIMKNIRANMEANDKTMEYICQRMVNRPAFRSCIINAFAYKYTHPDSEIVIGNMGFRNRKTPHLIWWEY